ncbi:Hypothetical_protein [Hexamita inflata]|uniref:Hypothetical_protein n=1 Tax=Hexamita inflata TaxID=28002 RepID=A0AA86QAR1_9EUKA|nr:Hypothetical protein HINF_LOCUS43339 [Hexamita inflata]
MSRVIATIQYLIIQIIYIIQIYISASLEDSDVQFKRTDNYEKIFDFLDEKGMTKVAKQSPMKEVPTKPRQKYFEKAILQTNLYYRLKRSSRKQLKKATINWRTKKRRQRKALKNSVQQKEKKPSLKVTRSKDQVQKLKLSILRLRVVIEIQLLIAIESS